MWRTTTGSCDPISQEDGTEFTKEANEDAYIALFYGSLSHLFLGTNLAFGMYCISY